MTEKALYVRIKVYYDGVGKSGRYAGAGCLVKRFFEPAFAALSVPLYRFNFL
jgi:hypothetical protein